MRILIPLLAAILATSVLSAQTGRRELTGHVRPGITAASDRGRISAARRLENVTLVLKRSNQQEAELQDLLARQQDPSSPQYHQWLTPDEFGARFGLPQSEIDQVTSWLASQNLTVDSVARGRTAISFSGNVRDVERAMQVEIHNYTINGETHFANASDPSVPVSIGGFVRAVHGLDNFRMKPRSVRSASQPELKPRYTSVSTGSHYLAPDDIATIFDIAPLYNSGITGKGQKIAVVGQTKINLSDIQQFRTYFNLGTNDPTVILAAGSKDPGIVSDDLGEADLDVEWSGAIARDASIIYVYADDVRDALAYAINQNLAPVISMSYGLCEQLSYSELKYQSDLADQASAEGISWVAASGDSGANDCYGITGAPPGLSVDAPASVPAVTGIGGTTLTEGAGQYWTTNNANHASALSYIPEKVWNDASDSSGGGGASTYFQKPSWQIGAGVPADGKRDVPDISLPASANHDGYMVYTEASMAAFGGTSVGAPVFAGIAALLNQYLAANGYQTQPGLGSLNPRLYALAANAPNAFHDVTAGNNIVASCAQRTCTTTVGYNAAPGYDQASGWGSVDAYNMVTAWPSTGTVVKAGASVGLTPSLSSLSSADTTTLRATVTGTGSQTPTGTVSFYASGNLLSSATLTGSGSSATANVTFTPSQIPGVSGDVVVSAVYTGDAVYGGAAGFATITVNSTTAMAINGVTSAASFQKVYAPGMVISLFGANLSGGTPDPPPAPLPTSLGGTTVTINGIAAPLYYVSPGQINVQIPWEIPRSSDAILKVTANGQSATSFVYIDRFAPEVFGDENSLMVPYQSTGRGQPAFLFATGDGLFTTPTMVTGSTPPSGTVSAIPTSAKVTVGGVPATVSFIGEPSWSVGVSQINFTIPATAPLGKQAVVVTIGGVASAPVYVTVTD